MEHQQAAYYIESLETVFVRDRYCLTFSLAFDSFGVFHVDICHDQFNASISICRIVCRELRDV